MQISIEIPDDVAQTLSNAQLDLSQAAIEALAIEGYRQDRLYEHQICRMLGLKSRMDVHAFLKSHKVPLNYSVADLDQDVKALALFEERLPA